MTFASGACVPVATVNPSDTRGVYVELSCSTDAQIADRTSTLATLTTVTDVLVSTPLSVLSSALQFASRSGGPPSTTSQGRKVYEFPYLSSGNVKTSTSTNAMTVASTASSTLFDGQYDAARIVMQRYPTSFEANGDLSSNEAEALPDGGPGG